MIRDQVVAEAESWLRTPYHSCARIKGAGVDCAQFPAAVYESTGLIPKLDLDYSPEWYMHQDEERYLRWVFPYSTEITREELLPGDFAIWKFGRTYSHGAIVIDKPTIIHATLLGGCVHYGNMDVDDDLLTRKSRYFRMTGIDDGR